MSPETCILLLLGICAYITLCGLLALREEYKHGKRKEAEIKCPKDENYIIKRQGY